MKLKIIWAVYLLLWGAVCMPLVSAQEHSDPQLEANESLLPANGESVEDVMAILSWWDEFGQQWDAIADTDTLSFEEFSEPYTWSTANAEYLQ